MPPRKGHVDNSSIVPVPVRKGALISLATEDGFGYSRKPAPSDGLYLEVSEGGYFLSIDVLEEALQALHDDMMTSPSPAEESAPVVNDASPA